MSRSFAPALLPLAVVEVVVVAVMEVVVVVVVVLDPVTAAAAAAMARASLLLAVCDATKVSPRGVRPDEMAGVVEATDCDGELAVGSVKLVGASCDIDSGVRVTADLLVAGIHEVARESESRRVKGMRSSTGDDCMAGSEHERSVLSSGDDEMSDDAGDEAADELVDEMGVDAVDAVETTVVAGDAVHLGEVRGESTEIEALPAATEDGRGAGRHLDQSRTRSL